MRIIDWATQTTAGRQLALARPRVKSRGEITRVVSEVIERVRREGDAAVRALTQRFDSVAINAFDVTAAEFREARRATPKAHIAAFERAIRNVERFHAACAPKPVQLEVEPGVRCEQLIRPIPVVGLYVPAGTAALPSSLIMQAIPARIAGCNQRTLCTPARRDGTAHPAVLTAAQLCGVTSVFKVGGAQAIAAMAYGTESIPKVDKIFGPGNAWVTSAKELVARDPQGAACDLPAGPSEVLIIADDNARADFVAADLLAQLEHDALSHAILVTNSRSLANCVAEEIHRQQNTLSRGTILTQSLRSSRCILVPDLPTAMEVANEYAPEHLILQVRDPRRWLPNIDNAGSVFLGEWSSEPLGDYCSGTNHVLPTDAHARTCSGLSVRDFIKTISVQEVSASGLKALGPTAVTFAELEGLDAHAQAVRRRLKALIPAGDTTSLAERVGLVS